MLKKLSVTRRNFSKLISGNFGIINVELCLKDCANCESVDRERIRFRDVYVYVYYNLHINSK